MTVEPRPTIRGSSDRLTDGFQGLNCASLRSETASPLPGCLLTTTSPMLLYPAGQARASYSGPGSALKVQAGCPPSVLFQQVASWPAAAAVAASTQLPPSSPGRLGGQRQGGGMQTADTSSRGLRSLITAAPTPHRFKKHLTHNKTVGKAAFRRQSIRLPASGGLNRTAEGRIGQPRGGRR